MEFRIWKLRAVAVSFEMSSDRQLVGFPFLEGRIDVIRKFLQGASESKRIRSRLWRPPQFAAWAYD
jgi:hypothetical protein